MSGATERSRDADAADGIQRIRAVLRDGVPRVGVRRAGHPGAPRIDSGPLPGQAWRPLRARAQGRKKSRGRDHPTHSFSDCLVAGTPFARSPGARAAGGWRRTCPSILGWRNPRGYPRYRRSRVLGKDRSTLGVLVSLPCGSGRRDRSRAEPQAKSITFYPTMRNSRLVRMPRFDPPCRPALETSPRLGPSRIHRPSS